MKKLITIITLSLIALFIYSNQSQPAQKATTAPLEQYTYTITSIDSEGIHAQSNTDHTGIFITHSTVEGLTLNESDMINVSFPKDDWETITEVNKID